MRNRETVEPNTRIVYVEVQVPSNYKLENDGKKPSSPRLRSLWWFAQANPEWPTNYSSEYYVGECGHLEKAVVKDFSGELPGELYAIVYCCDRCSWYLDYVFISKEKAQAYVAEVEGKFGQLYWVVPVHTY